MLRAYELTIEWGDPAFEAHSGLEDIYEEVILLEPKQAKRLEDLLDDLTEAEGDEAPEVYSYILNERDNPLSLGDVLDKMLPFVEPHKLRKVILGPEKRAKKPMS